MKLLGFLVTLLSLGCFTSFAQINKGTVLLGGTVSFEQNDASRDDLLYSPNNQKVYKKFSFGPRGAYFLKTNFALGLLVDYKHNKTRSLEVEQGIISEGQLQTIEAGPFVRYYYFARPELAFFGQAAVTYSHNYMVKDYHGINANVNLAPGLTYFISSKVGLELIIGGLSYNYSFHKPDENNKFTTSYIDARFMNGSQIGASFYLSR